MIIGVVMKKKGMRKNKMNHNGIVLSLGIAGMKV
jgi:hypothetical protein